MVFTSLWARALSADGELVHVQDCIMGVSQSAWFAKKKCYSPRARQAWEFFHSAKTECVRFWRHTDSISGNVWRQNRSGVSFRRKTEDSPPCLSIVKSYKKVLFGRLGPSVFLSLPTPLRVSLSESLPLSLSLSPPQSIYLFLCLFLATTLKQKKMRTVFVWNFRIILSDNFILPLKNVHTGT